MKVMLLKPPVRAFMVKIGRHMPIGLMYLASALEEEGHEVSIFDALAYLDDNHLVSEDDLTAADKQKLARHPQWSHLVHWGASWERVADAIAKAKPDVVGVSCMFTPYYEPAYQAVTLANEVAPDATTVLGGQHPTALPHHCLTQSSADLLVLGEAERTFPRLLEALAAGRPLVGLDGIAFHCNDDYCSCPEGGVGMHIAPNTSWIFDLDAVRLPAFEKIDYRHYNGVSTLITSRGCPFSCSFCTVHATVGKAFRARTADSILEEIRYQRLNYGIRDFNIEDDNFTFDMERVLQICRRVVEDGLDINLYLPNGMTVVKLTKQVADQMAAAGFKRMFFGLETTDPTRLRKIKKGFTSADKVEAGASWFAEHGVTASASLIVGLPGQTVAAIAYDSVNMMNRAVQFMTNPFYPIPGSQDFESCIELGLITRDTEPALYDMFNFSIGSDVLSPDELYWSWIATQAITIWPRYVRNGHLDRRRGRDIDSAQAVSELVDHSRRIAHDTQLKQAVSPVVADGLRVEVDADGCFCSTQRLQERFSGDGPPDVCAFTRDVIASAVSLYTGREHAGEQVSSSLTAPGQPCSFELHPAENGPRGPLLVEFENALNELVA